MQSIDGREPSPRSPCPSTSESFEEQSWCSMNRSQLSAVMPQVVGSSGDVFRLWHQDEYIAVKTIPRSARGGGHKYEKATLVSEYRTTSAIETTDSAGTQTGVKYMANTQAPQHTSFRRFDILRINDRGGRGCATKSNCSTIPLD
jgi:hypothetical protein